MPKASKLIVAVGTLVLALSCLAFAGCSNNENHEYDGKELVGEISEIDGSSVTMILGRFEENSDMPKPPDGQMGEPPAKPDGEQRQQSGDQPDAQQPPAKPDGYGTQPSNMEQQSKLPSEQQAADDPQSDEIPDALKDLDKEPQPSDAPRGGQLGEPPAGQLGEQPMGQPGGMSPMRQFKAYDDEVRTFDFSGAVIKDAQGRTVSVDTLKKGDVMSFTVSANMKVSEATIENAGQQGFNGAAGFNQGTSATTISEDSDIQGETYVSDGTDENALRVTDGAVVVLDGVDIQKNGGESSSTESGDFYGMNAAFLATDKAIVSIKSSKVYSNAKNGNGIFSYGVDTCVNVADTTIEAHGNNSGGLQTTGGAAMNAYNVNVTTYGNSAAAIRSDRGGGIVSVNGGHFETHGTGSPAIYSTATISVWDATLGAFNSEALVIEGKNSITLLNCEVMGKMMPAYAEQNGENVHNVMLYQSMSGDADEGTSVLTIEGGRLIGNAGDMFYVTNTSSELTLKGVEILNQDRDGIFLRVTGNNSVRGWGKAGANGATLDFAADGQEINGDIVVDGISVLRMVMSNGAVLTGTINVVDNAEGGVTTGNNADVVIGEGCVWNLTGDCVIDTLDNKGTINFNGHKIALTDGTVLS